MKKFIILLSVLLAIVICASFVYYAVPIMSNGEQFVENDKNTDNNSKDNSKNENSGKKDEVINIGSATDSEKGTNNINIPSINFSSSDKKITVADLKKQFVAAGVDDSNKYMFKPFYNVEQTTEFTFHFNSKVDPIKAITVHTDEKCDYLSLVWQYNEAYWTEDGIDVIVKPSSNTGVLYTNGRNGAEKGIWGYAPMYYLCIRYDLDSEEVKKLDNPIIIPFTVKNTISTPTVYANIDNKGTFTVKWNKVDDAVSYKVYSGKSAKVESLTAAETGYQDIPQLITTLDSSKLEFNPGYLLAQEKSVIGGEGYADNTIRKKDENYNLELVNHQNDNLYNLHAFYITAVDAKGNESNFGEPVMLNKYKETLPWRVKITELFSLEELPDTVSVESIDMKTIIQYPINFYKIENPSEYDSYCDYRYEVVGTNLTGIVNLKSEEKNFPEKSVSEYTPQSSLMPQNTIDKIPQVTIDTFADSDYKNSKVDLNKKVDYPESAKVQLDAGNIYMLRDKDMARREMFSVEIGAKDPREEFDSFIADDDPDYIVKREGNVITVEKVDKSNKVEKEPEEEKPQSKPTVEEPKEETPQSKPTVEEPKEETPQSKPTVEEPKEEKPQSKPTVEEPKKEKPADKIDNTNYVEEQRKSTEKQVEEADKEVIKGSKYPIFADNAAQTYLALAMINQEEEISLKSFPEYQNPNNVFDDVMYLWYQNPYIMGIDNGSMQIDLNRQVLLLKYNVPLATAQKYQEAVYNKSQQVVKQIIKPGMTDSEKVIAIYDYLEKNTEYNHTAMKYSETLAKPTDVYKKYPNSWNTYGILCEGLGVCQSYAYAFDLLAYLSDVDSVMVIGTLNNGGHAWNAVKLSGKWYMVDTTNNANIVGVPYWVCNTSTDFAREASLVLNDWFVDGTDYSEFLNSDNTKDWYYVNGLMIKSGTELGKIWEKQHKTNNVVAAKYSIKTEAEFNKAMQEFVDYLVNKGYTENDLADWKIGMIGGCIALVKD